MNPFANDNFKAHPVSSLERSRSDALLCDAGVVSPLFVTLLLTRISGIPMLEKSGLRRWGHDQRYRDYLKNTAVLVPFLW